jgi:hypothetical protein
LAEIFFSVEPKLERFVLLTILKVVSASENGVVTIWMVDTSQKVKQWTDAHGSAKLTALTQDLSETKILTGGTDGIVKVR